MTISAVALAEHVEEEGHQSQTRYTTASFEQLGPAVPRVRPNGIETLMDLPVQITVELGRISLPAGELLGIAAGNVFELNGYAGEPMKVFVNHRLIAQGEVVVVNEKLGIRFTDIVSLSERIQSLKR